MVVSIFQLMSNDESQKQQRKSIERAVHHSLFSSLEKLNADAHLLFELQFNNDNILSLLTEANLSIDLPKNLQLVQESLHKALYKQFQASQFLFPSQKIYTTKGKLLLDLQKKRHFSVGNSNADVSLDKVLTTLKPSFGLSLVNGDYSYRYFFPVFNFNSEFIAVVEVAIPIIEMQQLFLEQSDIKSQYLFAKRRLSTLTQKSKLYEQSEFSNNFFVHKSQNKTSEEDNVLKTIYLEKIQQSLTAKEQTKLMQLKPFSTNVSIGDEYGVAVFMPIMDVHGYSIGGKLSFVPVMKLYVSKSDHYMISLILLLILALMLFYMVKKSNASYQTQSYYQRFLDALPFPIFLKDSSDEYCGANKAFYAFFNIDKTQLLNHKKMSEYEADELKISIREINEAGGYIGIESNKLKENDTTTYRVSCYSTIQESPSKPSMVGYIKDVGKANLLYESLKTMTFDHTQLMDILPLGVRIFNLDGKTTYINQTLKRLSGFNENRLLNADYKDIFTCLQCSTAVCPEHKSIILKQSPRIEVIKYTTSGEPRTYELSYHPYFSIDKKIKGIVEITHDISTNKSLLDKNHELMLSDELTGLLNYRGLLSLGDNYFRLAERANKPFYALYVNIVGLSKINTEYGVKVGTQLLHNFTHILKETFRETDIIARTGSDEFVILMNDSEYQITDNKEFSRLESNIQRFNSQNTKEYYLAIETGIVEYKKENHHDLIALIKDAEQLVYEHRLKSRLN